MQNTVKEVEKHLMDISSLSSRVTIFENIFRILFIKRSDLIDRNQTVSPSNTREDQAYPKNSSQSTIGTTAPFITSEYEDEQVRESLGNISGPRMVSASDAEGLGNIATASNFSANELSTTETSPQLNHHIYIANVDLVSTVLTLLQLSCENRRKFYKCKWFR